MLYILDAQLKWLLRHGYCEWHCYRCKMKFSTAAASYYHLVDHHGLDPQRAFDDDLENPHRDVLERDYRAR